MKISCEQKKFLLLDDDKHVFHSLVHQFPNCIIDYYANPVHFLDIVSEKKFDLNRYDIIFSDYNFDNIGMNASELNLSKYIRKSGFENYLVLLSIQLFFDWKKIENEEYFDEVISKDDIPSLTIIFKRCLRSSYRTLWKERISKDID